MPFRRYSSTRERNTCRSVNSPGSKSPVLSPLTQRNRIALRQSEGTPSQVRVGLVAYHPVAVSNRDRAGKGMMTETTKRLPANVTPRSSSSAAPRGSSKMELTIISIKKQMP